MLFVYHQLLISNLTILNYNNIARLFIVLHQIFMLIFQKILFFSLIVHTKKDRNNEIVT